MYTTYEDTYKFGSIYSQITSIELLSYYWSFSNCMVPINVVCFVTYAYNV